MNKSHILDYAKFDTFLRSEVEKISNSKWGAKKAIAEVLRIHPSLLSQILAGTRLLTDEQVFLLTEYMGLNDLESDYVYNLFRISNTGNKQLIKKLSEKNQALKKASLKISERVKIDKKLSDEEKSIMYSSWHYIAIWVFISLDKGKTMNEIMERYSLPMKLVREILDFLLTAKLVDVKDGVYQLTDRSIHIDKTSPFFKQHHSNWRVKSVQKMDNLNLEEINFSAPMSLSKKDFEKIREVLLKQIDEIYKTIRETDPEEVYCLNIDFFTV